LIVKWAGKDYSYDPSGVTVAEAVLIKNHTGYGLVSWERACRDADPQAIQALLWLIKRRNGEVCEPASLDFDVIAFLAAYGEAVQAENDRKAADEGKADSPGDGSTPEPTLT
jgi:hypothetical protein